MRVLAIPVGHDRPTLSMSAGLDVSTVTPGSTAPEVSLTTPVMDAWAYAAVGTTASHASTTNASRRHGRRFTLTSSQLLSANVEHNVPIRAETR